MALLDIFGDTPSYYGGLLGEEELQRARDYAQQQALQNSAMALLQAGAPSRTPGGGALAIAQGLQMGQQAYKQAMNESLKDRLTQFQIQDMMQKRAEEQAARQQQAQAQRILQSAYRPEQGMIGQTPSEVLRDEEGNLMPGANVRPAGLDLQAALPALRALGPAGTKTLTEQLNIEKTLSDLAKSQRPEGFTLGEGQERYEVQNGQIVKVAGTPKEKAIQWQDLGNVVVGIRDGVEVARLPKGRAPEGPVSLQTIETEQGVMTFNPRTGQLTPVTQDGKPVMGKGAKPTEGQLNAAGFAQRMVVANDLVGQPQLSKAAPGGVSAAVGSIPFIGESLKNLTQKPETQQYAQAARDWIRAKLRKESGAAIGVQEEENEFRTYFPVVGDSPAVLAQKAQARKLATDGMIQSAGNAFKMPELPKPAEKPILRWNPRTNSFEAS
ncbi:hypothetical protein [Caudoviricetes sp.]|nr:hypothetical protein [Caudoviricetes sp.]UOF78395.1 hypothetical protein [Bacteriophage sp.]